MLVCDMISTETEMERGCCIKKNEGNRSSGVWVQTPIIAAGRAFKSLDELIAAFETVLKVNENLNKQLESLGKQFSELQSPKAAPGKLEKITVPPINILKEDTKRIQQEVVQKPMDMKPIDNTCKKSELTLNIKSVPAKVQVVAESPKKSPQPPHPEMEYLKNPKDEVDISIWQEGRIPDLVQQLLDKGKKDGWLYDGSEFQLGRRLGRGSSGTTYKAMWNNKEVAVKCVRIRKQEEVISFLREVDALASFKHPYILPFIGICLKPPRQCWLVMEYMKGATLNHWLYGRKNGQRRKRSLADRVFKALEVARGLQHLEECKPHPFLHRDVKPGNIFIDPTGRARVGDFGLARRLTRDAIATLTGETGTYVYMAPEVLRHEVYDSKADVYSWGVLFAELINQRPPYSELQLTPIQVGIAVSDEELQPTIQSQSCPGVFHTLLQMCCDPDPIMRPSFRQIVQHLDALMPEIKNREALVPTSSPADVRYNVRAVRHYTGTGHAGSSQHSASTYAPTEEQENF
eukprot:TRINITY_DN2987_c1_g1_i2.p2 TRINITY_DN2987_c1_g1~~TRINITY_DN2987_c1_g1_i2.p2  ORF type:complete len:518 (+),score=63.36 TRINITY_DN2987_c1_g1_i2:270-1823(+)